MPISGLIVSTVLAAATAQQVGEAANNVDRGDQGWVRPPGNRLRALFQVSHKRDVGDFELLRISEEEWTRPYISADGARVFVGTRSGQVLALDPIEGKLLWRRREMGTVGASMAEWQGVLLVGSDSDLLALDRATGETRWRSELRGRVGGVITVVGNTAVVPVRPNAYVAVALEEGKEKWRTQRQTPSGITVRGQAAATVDSARKTAYLGFSDGAVVAVDVEDGGTKWLVQLGERKEFFADVDAAPVLVDGGRSVIVASYNGGLARLKADTGEVLYKKPDVDRLVGLVSVPDGLLVGAYGDGQLIGIYASSGKIRWRYRFGRGAPTPPILVDDRYVLAGCTEGPIVVLKTSTGEPVQLVDLASGVSTTPFYRSPYLAALANTGLLLVLRKTTRSVISPRSL